MTEKLITPFARTFALPSGDRVRVRLARPSDRAGVRELLEARGLQSEPLELGRLLNFDPRKRLVLAATTPADGTEALTGIGAIDLQPDAEPDVLVVAQEGLGELLGEILINRAEAHARRAA
jgi:hypothetical protein